MAHTIGTGSDSAVPGAGGGRGVPAVVMEDSDVWAAEAISRLRLDGPGPTPLCSLVLPAVQGIGIHAGDESAHPAGSVKYRLVRAMFREAVAGPVPSRRTRRWSWPCVGRDRRARWTAVRRRRSGRLRRPGLG
ncbi:hypothetical protein ACFU6R_33020 [Streptomyces sp. NPDC057499]|uniref:hypothetical protein n=1 Tax=Streptomyces sp. NPDC057499 TaxID=3346150 RepID=UPI0036CC71FE